MFGIPVSRNPFGALAPAEGDEDVVSPLFRFDLLPRDLQRRILEAAAPVFSDVVALLLPCAGFTANSDVEFQRRLDAFHAVCKPMSAFTIRIQGYGYVRSSMRSVDAYKDVTYPHDHTRNKMREAWAAHPDAQAMLCLVSFDGARFDRLFAGACT